MNIYIPEIWEPYQKTWWQRVKKDSHWAWWERKCICGADLCWNYIPELKKKHKRCSNYLSDNRHKCPFYSEHDELVKRGIITYIPVMPKNR